jgi:hypothetical protein
MMKNLFQKVFRRHSTENIPPTDDAQFAEVSGLIQSAKRDFDFIIHFNSEMFHQSITAGGESFTKETVNGIYENERYMKIIDLSDLRERMGFISLYAMTFHGLHLSDLYSVDNIFSLDGNRETDDKKRLAGQEVFNLIYNENRREIITKVFAMTGVVGKLPLPEINLNIDAAIKKNYTLYCGIGDIGRAFSRLILSEDKAFEDAVKTARRLSYYRMLEKYYAEILKSGRISSKDEFYKSVKSFANAAAGKATAGELGFTVKGTRQYPIFN